MFKGGTSIINAVIIFVHKNIKINQTIKFKLYFLAFAQFLQKVIHSCQSRLQQAGDLGSNLMTFCEKFVSKSCSMRIWRGELKFDGPRQEPVRKFIGKCKRTSGATEQMIFWKTFQKMTMTMRNMRMIKMTIAMVMVIMMMTMMTRGGR